MIAKILLAAAVIFLAAGGWVAVQSVARRYAARHSALGAVREEGGGGCGTCHCIPAKSCEGAPEAKKSKGMHERHTEIHG